MFLRIWQIIQMHVMELSHVTRAEIADRFLINMIRIFISVVSFPRYNACNSAIPERMQGLPAGASVTSYWCPRFRHCCGASCFLKCGVCWMNIWKLAWFGETCSKTWLTLTIVMTGFRACRNRGSPACSRLYRNFQKTVDHTLNRVWLQKQR